MTIAPQSSTVNAIRQKVRRITASTESMLTTEQLDQYINTAYTQEFPYAIKLDQMIQVYSFLTSPFQSRYPLDMNMYMGVRGDVYIQGKKGFFFKDLDQFYNMWPRLPTLFTPAIGDGTTTTFTFNIGSQSPFLPTTVTLGSIDINGNTIQVKDDGGRDTNEGNLLFITTNNVGNAVPPTPNTSPIPPASPIPSNSIGTVNYVTGQFSITFPTAPAEDAPISVWVSQYNAAQPYSVLFWNNEFQVRPVPNNVYNIEVKVYFSPVQFLSGNEDPLLNQWWQYLSLIVSKYVLQDRNDYDGVQQLMPELKYQEGLVLERQAVEEIGSRNTTIYASANQNWGNNNWGSWGPW